MNIEWIPSPNHYNGRLGDTPRIIVIHHTDGGISGSIATFQNPANQVSAHYIVSADGRRVVQMVHEYDAAWACEMANKFTINIECEDYPEGGIVFNGYDTLMALIQGIASRNGITLGVYTIVPHKVYVNTQCPAGVDIARIVAMVTGVPTNAPVAIPQGTQTSAPAPSPARQSAHVTSPGGLYVRLLNNTKGNPLRLMKNGDGFYFTGIVDGEDVQGNNKWFLLEDGHYAWSGGATIDTLTA